MNASLTAFIGIAAFIVGQWLVTRKQWTGFLVWAGSNLMVAAMCLVQDNRPTACMFLVYCLANVYSMIAWSRSAATHEPELLRSTGAEFRRSR
jgi:nicotinamide riboside transporter PnuC